MTKQKKKKKKRNTIKKKQTNNYTNYKKNVNYNKTNDNTCQSIKYKGFQLKI